MRELTWSLILAIDFWAAGMAGGAYFSAFMLHHRFGDRFKSLLLRALIIGIPSVSLGVFLLVLDLGEPLRAWHLFVRFRHGSPMSMGTWILFFWLVFGIALLILWVQGYLEKLGSRSRIVKAIADWLKPFVGLDEFLSWLVFILGILMMLYTGVVLGTSNRPLWSASFFMPALFLCSGVISGAAAVGLTMLIWPLPDSEEVTASLTRAVLMVVGLEVVILAAHFIWLGSASSVEVVVAARSILSGRYWFRFWGGAVVLGIAIPLALQLSVGHRKGKLWSSILAVSALSYLIGAFFLRSVFLIGGQG